MSSWFWFLIGFVVGGTAEAAAREARRMAKRNGGRAVVEYWSRRHGLRPRDLAVVEGGSYVD